MSAAYPRGGQAPTSDSPGTRLGRAPTAPRTCPDVPRGPADQGARPDPGSGLPEQCRGWAAPREGVRRRDPTPQRRVPGRVTGRKRWSTGQLTATIGRRSAPGADSGTTGWARGTAATGVYVVPRGGRGAASSLFGQYAIARSAWAVIVNDGFTPRFAETAEPSATWRPGWP